MEEEGKKKERLTFTAAGRRRDEEGATTVEQRLLEALTATEKDRRWCWKSVGEKEGWRKREMAASLGSRVPGSGREEDDAKEETIGTLLTTLFTERFQILMITAREEGDRGGGPSRTEAGESFRSFHH
ncbi:hypothetical protein LXL04_036757 [Taraxacum kok-saghyz]